MKLSKIAVAALSLFLVSCSNESDLDTICANSTPEGVTTKSVSEIDYYVENGCLNFVNMEAYSKVIHGLEGKSNNELLDWNRNQGFNSLLDVYQNKNNIIIKSEGENSEEIPYEMSNSVFSSLFNQNGLMIINDSIYKVIDEYVYIIANKDFSTLEKLEKNPSSYNDLPIASRYLHTRSLKSESKSRGVSDGNRSFVINVGSKRREFADFNVNVSTASNGVLYLDISLLGRAQKKHLWWGKPFDDEFQFAYFRCTGGSVNDRIMFDGFTSGTIKGASKVSKSIPLGVSSAIDYVRTTIEFNFTKNTLRPNELYTNSYYINN